MTTFEKLTQERIIRKVKQSEIAKHLHLNKGTVSRYEKGEREIGSWKQDEYADYLGLELKLMVK